MHDVCYHDPEPASAADPSHRWPKYDAIAARALAKAPADRYPTAGSFRAAILVEYARPVSDAISEATIISEPMRPMVHDRGTPSVPHSSSAPSTNSPPPTGWDAKILTGIERELARHVGPVARVLVRRAAREHQDFQSLVAALLPLIDNRADQEAFATAIIGRPTLAPVFASTGHSDQHLLHDLAQGPPLSDDELERATRLLTSYIGPIARVVAKRAAARGGGRREFFSALVQSLENEAQRERFLREAGVAGG